DRRLRTAGEVSRELAITRLDALAEPLRRALAESGVAVVELAEEDAGQPTRAIQAARRELERARLAEERGLAERCLAELGPDEWLVVDGVLSDSAALSAHRRAIGVIKSHGAQYFEGAELERALTLPAGHRTSVFQPRSRGARERDREPNTGSPTDRARRRHRAEAGHAAPISLLDRERDDDRDWGDRSGRRAGGTAGEAGRGKGRLRRGDRRVRVLRSRDSAARRRERRG